MPDGAQLIAVDEPSNGTEGLGLTEKQAAFVRFFVLMGGNSTEAARLAGYQHPGPAGYTLKNIRHVAAAIARAVGREMVTDGSRMAWGVIKLALERDDVRMADRLKAAFRTLDFVQAVLERDARSPGAGRDLADMTPDELRAVVAAGGAALEKLADAAVPAGASSASQEDAGQGAPCGENGVPSPAAGGGGDDGLAAIRTGGAAGKVKRKAARPGGAEE